MALNIEPAPNYPVLGSASFDTDAGAFLSWMQTVSAQMSNQNVMTPGDFGLGATGFPTVITNLNLTTTPSGFYCVTDATTGTVPFGVSPYGYVLVERYNGAQIKQTYTPVGGAASGGQNFVRVYNATSGSWESWQRQYAADNILGAVSQSGGIPTGAVIQHGSNPNGEFTRFADGTQICTATGILPDAPVTFAAGNIFTSSEVTWTFPAAFSITNDLYTAANPRIGTTLWSRSRTASATSALVKHFSAQSSGSPVDIELFAVGRWF
ncbi:hypothetical protein SAMN05444339_11042 [Loktanella atrilutea]|uniref:Uncharacterized protein n=1 Tax=Loktanella atrilutea TaxID=366533 RepID=A0A1M5DL30_LOKAT|nr:pyocin knob domain-containing protein [Loktanella atrilutea]SHF67683.1 hypothetical protein SAMN05444339_11042 [Loktanella atrilutea]